MPEERSLLEQGAHVMTVCNACRYCEQFCAVFPAMEQRVTFAATDLAYLANLCHNCGECLQACQYAPPHEFGINVPVTLARIRVHSYEEYCWPRCFGVAFRRHNLLSGLGLAAALMAVIAAALMVTNPAALTRPGGAGDFYAVVPHDVMVGLFGGVSLLVVAALAIGTRRAMASFGSLDSSGSLERAAGSSGGLLQGVQDALSLRYLHGSGADCVSAEETRRPWRRWFHHATFYGFLSCVGSTTVAAAVYHSLFGWPAPYGYASLPVLLGAVGGAGLIVGPAGLLTIRGWRDPASNDPDLAGMDASFIALLLLTSITGMALLALRRQPLMGALLVVHLGAVLALLATLPYGKFVHGLYRTAALIKSARERVDR